MSFREVRRSACTGRDARKETERRGEREIKRIVLSPFSLSSHHYLSPVTHSQPPPQPTHLCTSALSLPVNTALIFSMHVTLNVSA